MVSVVRRACGELAALLDTVPRGDGEVGRLRQELAALAASDGTLRAFIDDNAPPTVALETLEPSRLPPPFAASVAALAPHGDVPLGQGWCVVFGMYTALGVDLTAEARRAHAFVRQKGDAGGAPLLSPGASQEPEEALRNLQAQIGGIMGQLMTNPDSTGDVMTGILSMARQTLAPLGTDSEQSRQLILCLDTLGATFHSLMATQPPPAPQ